MNIKPIYISRNDYDRLTKLTNELIAANPKREAVLRLQQELKRAIVEEGELPKHIVALNSRVSIRDLTSGELEEYVLTMPEKADLEENRISVLAPIGTALLGFGEGDEVSWTTPGGERTFRIEKVEQGVAVQSAIPPYIPEYLLGRSTA